MTEVTAQNPWDFQEEALHHAPALYGAALRMTRRQSDAEDLVQDTLLKAIRARHQFQVGTNLRAWLLRILTNTFINKYKRGNLERSLTHSEDLDPVTDGWMGTATLRALRDPEASMMRPVMEAEIRAKVEALPEEFRLAVLLVDMQELSYKEAAEALGCPIGTVMSRLHRGRRILKEQLEERARSLGLLTAEAEAKTVALSSYRARKSGGGE